MPRDASHLDRELMAGIRKNLRFWQTMDRDALDYHDPRKGRISDALDNLLWVDFEAWIGRVLSDAERRSYSRALARLEAAGKIRRGCWRFSFGSRTTCIRIPKRVKR